MIIFTVTGNWYATILTFSTFSLHFISLTYFTQTQVYDNGDNRLSVNWHIFSEPPAYYRGIDGVLFRSDKER